MRAAQYVRMSTEKQEYSIPYQLAAIKEYASLHGFEIVRTYTDEARSGIDLQGRPGLRQLLDDVVTCCVDYSAILVYDVSRWGRFQDTDEAAHWEFVCKNAGVNVEYCAEPFANDTSPFTALFKTFKRTMASEYLRELSARVFAAQCQLARRGYKLGGPAGYGLRRLLLSSDGTIKQVLEHGQRKALITDRVRYVAGPESEVRVVRKIYELFLKDGLNCSQIAAHLNKRGVRKDGGRAWTGWFVQRILSHPKYVGCVVYNQKSSKLKSKPRRNPSEQWIITRDCFEPIISKDRFDAAQKKLRNRVFLRSDEQLLAELAAFVGQHGKATCAMLRRDRNMARGLTYAGRFGSLSRALDKVQREPPDGWSESQVRARIKRNLHDEFGALLTASNLNRLMFKSMFLFPNRSPILVEVARCIKKRDGQLKWQIRYPTGKKSGKLGCVALRLAPDNRTRMDYVYFAALPERVQRMEIGEATIRQAGAVRQQLSEIAALVLGS